MQLLNLYLTVFNIIMLSFATKWGYSLTAGEQRTIVSPPELLTFIVTTNLCLSSPLQINYAVT